MAFKVKVSDVTGGDVFGIGRVWALKWLGGEGCLLACDSAKQQGDCKAAAQWVDW